ncbi:hypothetical protein SKAU_G00007750 [Synaphobranchus kaupii]|uniref:Uncharacterized protein n=1 Tax=Synaphobranchus kaupii TaxID=118154 RepID=A0A9Q1GB91_SYNKA|nr:hypothetical protein SKAU_G00007750 [Synaphobranchus kaupii]
MEDRLLLVSLVSLPHRTKATPPFDRATEVELFNRYDTSAGAVQRGEEPKLEAHILEEKLLSACAYVPSEHIGSDPQCSPRARPS